MKLKVEIIERLRGRRDIKQKITRDMGIVKSTLWRWMILNEEDGPLTAIKCASIIAEGLNVDLRDLYVEEPSNVECHEPFAHS